MGSGKWMYVKEVEVSLDKSGLTWAAWYLLGGGKYVK